MFLGENPDAIGVLGKNLVYLLLRTRHTLRGHAGAVAASSSPTPCIDLQSLPKGEIELVQVIKSNYWKGLVCMLSAV